ncbi:hypothetical protein [Streptomyces purpurascens]|uniref:Uncharacterized protein n=1 Tax=Streptomyces purpurascens TaxID=1924 RepID=A0ABZ1MD28_STREF|nr:hypothetical protein [Streptomyces purpurascens]MCE7047857.1 hypothetical protein [Streptomyces purpurascens]GHA17507.1 hypothetical protein GCM10010303_29430 [Streptomyces purpurascens]
MTTVEQIAADLDADEARIDYAKRRRREASWRFPENDWDALFDGLPRLERMQAMSDKRVVSALVWAETNQADVSYSPIVTGVRKAGGDALTLSACALNPMTLELRGARARLRRRLHLYAARLADACDRDQTLDISMRDVVAEETRAHAATNARK